MPQIRVLGHSLEYEWIDGEGPTLVFLHEGLGSIRQWREFPRRVAQVTGRSALVYDRYGYGRSDVLAEPRVGVRFMHDAALLALPALLGELGVDAPILIGHSDGASIALIYAGAGYAARGVIAIAPHVFVEDICIESIEKAKRDFETTDLAKRLYRYHRDPRKTFHLWNDVWLDPQFRTWDITEYLPTIRCPVLAVQGYDDPYGSMAQLDVLHSKVAVRCELVKLESCGHTPHRDQPDLTLEAVTRFIGSIGQ